MEPNQGRVRPQDCLSAPWLHRAGAPAPPGCLHGDPEGPCPVHCVCVCVCARACAWGPGAWLQAFVFFCPEYAGPWRPPLSATSLLDGLSVPVEFLLASCHPALSKVPPLGQGPPRAPTPAASASPSSSCRDSLKGPSRVGRTCYVLVYLLLLQGPGPRVARLRVT